MRGEKETGLSRERDVKLYLRPLVGLKFPLTLALCFSFVVSGEQDPTPRIVFFSLMKCLTPWPLPANLL